MTIGHHGVASSSAAVQKLKVTLALQTSLLFASPHCLRKLLKLSSGGQQLTTAQLQARPVRCPLLILGWTCPGKHARRKCSSTNRGNGATKRDHLLGRACRSDRKERCNGPKEGTRKAPSAATESLPTFLHDRSRSTFFSVLSLFRVPFSGGQLDRL